MSVRPRPIFLLVVAAAAAACGNSASTMNVTGPAGVRCQASVANSAPASFGPAGGTGTISVTVSRECAWQAVSQSPFVLITGAAEGQGDGTVTYRVNENSEPVGRQGTLLVSERQVGIAQSGAPCQFEVWPDAEGPLGAQPGEVGVQVRTHALCDWAATSEVAWARVVPASGRGNGAVRIEVEGNNTGAPRPVAVVVANARVALTQGSPAAPVPPPAPTPPPPTPTPTPTPTPPPPTPTPTPTPPPPSPTPTPTPTPPAPTPPEPTPVGSIELEGRVSAVSGSCPAITFQLRGQTVYTTSATRYDDGNCGSVRNGREVEVRGMLMSDGRVRADRVEIDD